MKTILISGASSGLGLFLSELFVRNGNRVVGFARSTGQMEPIARTYPDRFMFCKADITSTRELDELVQFLDREHIAPDVLVNNAGYCQPGAVLDVPAAAIHRQFEVNLFGLIELTRRVVPGMIERQQGLVMNIGSSAGRISSPFNGIYASSKHALAAISESLRAELTPFGVAVTLIELGRLDTPLVEKSAEAGRSLQSSAATSRFQPYFARVVAEGEQNHGQPVQAFGDKFLKVLSTRHPAPRYTFDPYTGLLFGLRSFLPDRIYEALMLRKNGLRRPQRK